MKLKEQHLSTVLKSCSILNMLTKIHYWFRMIIMLNDTNSNNKETKMNENITYICFEIILRIYKSLEIIL